MIRRLRKYAANGLSALAQRLRGPAEFLDEFGDDFLHQTDSGEYVGRRAAYTFHGWYRALDLISSQVAKTSIRLWDKRGDQKKPAKNHFAWKLLCGHGQPNPETFRYHFVQTLTAHAVGHGGGFAYIMRNELGQATELIQLRPDRTYPVRENGRLMYLTAVGGDYGDTGVEVLKLLQENVLHIYGLGWDGLTGYSVLDLASRSLGSAIAKERFGSRYFRNAAKPSVVIEVPGKLSEPAFNNLKRSWNEAYVGMTEAHKAAILESGAKATPFSHSAADAQLIEACERDPVIVSNFTGVPPYLLGVKGYNSNSTLETQSQNLLDFTIDPWMVPWEQALNGRLLREREKAAGSHEFLFYRKDLIRVDAAKRSAMNRTALGGHPYMRINEVRAEEDLDLDDDGDFIPAPLNMGQLGETPPEPEPAPVPAPAADTEDENRDALTELWRQTAGRMARRLSTAHERTKADAARLLQDHGPTIREAFTPLLALSSTETEADQLATILCDSVAAGRSTDDVISLALQQIGKRNEVSSNS